MRISLEGARDKLNKEVLSIVKRTIPVAATIRVLRSGDIDITLPSEVARESI